eukprot:m.439382 g.439382  ORF g.439382 m.439382 type:complete len:85 (-) comp56789_c0_seq17:2360-2614(-)
MWPRVSPATLECFHSQSSAKIIFQRMRASPSSRAAVLSTSVVILEDAPESFSVASILLSATRTFHSTRFLGIRDFALPTLTPLR